MVGAPSVNVDQYAVTIDNDKDRHTNKQQKTPWMNGTLDVGDAICKAGREGVGDRRHAQENGHAESEFTSLVQHG
jgi:hypothetical protein